jgi:ubiquinone/menaquinone biosynthesis C-methylase UbiE
MSKNFKSGSQESFDNNWKNRPELLYNHWCKGEPQNQIQLAFYQHHDLFKHLLNKKGKIKMLEVGCGRGSLSSFFAEEKNQCYLLDTSESVISRAKNIFKKNNHEAKFFVEDATKTSFPDNSFDFVVSIGLLEHFENIDDIIKEQYRILTKDGVLINYIVPENKNNIQKDYNWINDILNVYYDNSELSKEIIKDEVFRSDADSEVYIESYKKNGFNDIFSSGVYPLPMISHSIEFPFSLMDSKAEKLIVRHFLKILNQNNKLNKHPWLCEESYGQAFIVKGTKS